MNDLGKRFIKFRDDFPYLGDVIIMSMSVEGMRYSKEIIRRAFNKFVSLEEYDSSEKNEIITGLIKYSNNDN